MSMCVRFIFTDILGRKLGVGVLWVAESRSLGARSLGRARTNKPNYFLSLHTVFPRFGRNFSSLLCRWEMQYGFADNEAGCKACGGASASYFVVGCS